MNLTVQRHTPVDDGVPGTLEVDGVFQCFTLERLSKIILPGGYSVALTVSQRALEGHLWSPDPDCRLPLIQSVVGRSGIRIHAANQPDELLGCLAVGKVQAGENIRQSRAAFIALWSLLVIQPNGTISIDIHDPTP